MYIKSVADLQDHPHGAAVMKALNKAVYKGAEYCYFLPSHLLSTGAFIRDFQKSQMLDVSNALSKYSPFETRLLMAAIESRTDADVERVTSRIRNANRMTARFISNELLKVEQSQNTFMFKLKKKFTNKNKKVTNA